MGDKYEIIAGERRYKASLLAGKTTIPAVITNLNDKDSAEVALIENVQRKDLTSIEEARSYKNMLDRGNMTQEELAKKMGLSQSTIGKNQSTIANKLRLLNLDESVQNALMQEKISERHARALLSISNKDEQKNWLDRIINERLTVRQLDLAIKDELAEKKQIGAQEGDVPIVDINPDIESIINNAVDINPVDTKRDMDILNGSPKLTEEVNAVKTEVSDVNDNEVKIEAEPEKEEPAKPQNKFFNVLESEEVNMNMEEKPKKAPEFATSPNGIFNFTPEFKEEPQPENVPVENVENNEIIEEPVINNVEVNQEEVQSLPDEPIFDEQSVISEEVPQNNNVINEEVNQPVENIPQEIEQPVQEYNQPSGFVFDEEPDVLFENEPVEQPNAPVPVEQPVQVETTNAEPQVNNDFVAEPIPPMEGEGITDPVTYYDALDPDFMQRVREAIGTDLKTAINSYRDLTTLLNEKGFKISIEEADAEHFYSILINVEKE